MRKTAVVNSVPSISNDFISILPFKTGFSLQKSCFSFEGDAVIPTFLTGPAACYTCEATLGENSGLPAALVSEHSFIRQTGLILWSGISARGFGGKIRHAEGPAGTRSQIHTLMVEASDNPRLNELRARIEELNSRGTRVLIFLSFGIAAAVLLWSADLLSVGQQDFLLRAMRWWVLAIVPTVIGVLPLKEIRENNHSWYGFVRWLKFVLMWLAIIFILAGTTYFLRCIVGAQPVEDTESTMLRFILTITYRHSGHQFVLGACSNGGRR